MDLFDDGRDGQDEVPWASFSDGMSALLFVFMILTVVAMINLRQITKKFEERVKIYDEAEENNQRFLDGILKCVPKNGDMKLVLSGENSVSMMLIDKHSNQKVSLVNWFAENEAKIVGQAQQSIRKLRQCLFSVNNHGQTIEQLMDTYTIQLTLEGHSDAIRSGGVKYPSNWELSGARAAAALREMLCEDSSGDGLICPCVENENECIQNRDEAERLRVYSSDPSKLQISAVGFADSRPAKHALCQELFPKIPSKPIVDETSEEMKAWTNKVTSLLEESIPTTVIDKEWTRVERAMCQHVYVNPKDPLSEDWIKMVDKKARQFSTTTLSGIPQNPKVFKEVRTEEEAWKFWSNLTLYNKGEGELKLSCKETFDTSADIIELCEKRRDLMRRVDLRIKLIPDTDKIAAKK